MRASRAVQEPLVSQEARAALVSQEARDLQALRVSQALQVHLETPDSQHRERPDTSVTNATVKNPMTEVAQVERLEAAVPVPPVQGTPPGRQRLPRLRSKPERF